MIRIICFYGIVLAFTSIVNAKTAFYTERLKTIAEVADFHIPDTLGKSVVIDSLCLYKGRPIRIKTNIFGDISHIGYRIFDRNFSDSSGSMVTFYDFIERYFLELDLEIGQKKTNERIFLDKVVCSRGNMGMRHMVTENTGFNVHHVGRRGYKVQWFLDRDTLELIVPADCQLILGANAIELEQIFERDVKRLVPKPYQWSDEELPILNDQHGVIHSGSYLSGEIRSDLYCYRQKDSLKLVVDPDYPIESIKNILLTGHFMRDISMALTIDQYGYKKSRAGITLQQYIEYCRMEGCTMYVGIKTQTENRVTATMFALNNELGYNHVLAVDFPVGILAGKPISIMGIAYVYIPLQNVTEKFFMQETNEK